MSTKGKFRLIKSITLTPDEIEFIKQLAITQKTNFSRALSTCVDLKRRLMQKKLKSLAKKL